MKKKDTNRLIIDNYAFAKIGNRKVDLNPKLKQKFIDETRNLPITEKFKYMLRSIYLNDEYFLMSDDAYDDVDIFFNEFLNIEDIWVHKIRRMNMFKGREDRFYEHIDYIIITIDHVFMLQTARNVYYDFNESLNKSIEIKGTFSRRIEDNERKIADYLNISQFIY